MFEWFRKKEEVKDQVSNTEEKTYFVIYKDNIISDVSLGYRELYLSNGFEILEDTIYFYANNNIFFHSFTQLAHVSAEFVFKDIEGIKDYIRNKENTKVIFDYSQIIKCISDYNLGQGYLYYVAGSSVKMIDNWQYYVLIRDLDAPNIISIYIRDIQAGNEIAINRLGKTPNEAIDNLSNNWPM